MTRHQELFRRIASISFTVLSCNITTAEGSKVLPSAASKDEQFGTAIALSAEHAIVAGFRNVFFYKTGIHWQEQYRYTVDGPPSRLAVSIDGNICLVGAPGNRATRGSVRVFRHDGLVWSAAGELVPEDDVIGARFGAAVAISGDYCIVGAPSDSSRAKLEGAVYIFRRSAGAWTQDAKLFMPTAGAGSRVGEYLAMCDDYAVVTLQVSACRDLDFGNVQRAHVLHRGDGGWKYDTLSASETEPLGALFFFPVAMSSNRIVVGGYLTDRGAMVVVFRREHGEWKEEDRLTGSPLHRTAFGAALAMTDEYLVVGAPLNRGVAYVFRRYGSRWIRVAQLDMDVDGGRFALAVGCSDALLVVGSPRLGTTGAVFAWRALGDSQAYQAEEINSMSVDEARAAWAEVARAMQLASEDDEKQRLRADFVRLKGRLKELLPGR